MPTRAPRAGSAVGNRRRKTAAQRGYGGRWQRYRLLFLSRHPLCAECERQGRVTEADVVDHIVPHRGDLELFWRPDNHQALCRPCHDAKTARGE